MAYTTTDAFGSFVPTDDFEPATQSVQFPVSQPVQFPVSQPVQFPATQPVHSSQQYQFPDAFQQFLPFGKNVENAQDDVDDHEKQIEELQVLVNELRLKNQEIERQHDALESDVEALQAENDELRLKLEESSKHIPRQHFSLIVDNYHNKYGEGERVFDYGGFITYLTHILAQLPRKYVNLDDLEKAVDFIKQIAVFRGQNQAYSIEYAFSYLYGSSLDVLTKTQAEIGLEVMYGWINNTNNKYYDNQELCIPLEQILEDSS
jgi:hypothetical protein